MKLSDAKKLKSGDKVYWDDPNGDCSREYKIKSVELDGFYVVIEDVDGSILDCYAKELKQVVE